MLNMPRLRLGLVAVSRDCFPVELSQRRRDTILEECNKQNFAVTGIETIIENEKDVLKALDEIGSNDINALVIYLGNFGPEGPISSLAQRFEGPVMICAAAEETKDDLINGRGDAYCGLLSASYNLGLRNVRVHIPEYPVGTAPEIVEMMRGFSPVARAMIGLKHLKIFSFGPRPQDFNTCHAPLKPLYDLGVEVMENSELDLYDLYQQTEDNPKIEQIEKEMAVELGAGNTYPDLLRKLAQLEVTLLNFYEENLSASEFGVFAIKCWPAFEKYFGCVPCYVNGRLAEKGIPVACEVDVYGVLSEYIGAVASGSTPTLLDINNSVPRDMYEAAGDKVGDYRLNDLFMGFHCGNTASSCMMNAEMRYQLIMHRLMEPGEEPDITRGTLEGQLAPSDVTMYRLQSTASGELKAYIAQGEILNVDPQSFGGIGVIAIKEMGRFYRYTLLEKEFPHHSAVVFGHAGKALYEIFKLLGIEDISVNLPREFHYPDENPFK
jgi:L-fucose isomerase-like protein